MGDKHTPVITDDSRILGYRVGANVYTCTQEANKAIRRREGDSWIPLYRAHHAAPDMLSALETLVDAVDGPYAPHLSARGAEAVALARAAISKARGAE